MPVEVLSQEDFEPVGMNQAAQTLGRKAALTAEQFARLADEHKRRAFTLAKVNNAKVIQQARDTIARAMKAGTSYRDVRLELLRVFKEAGIDSPPLHRLRFAYQQQVTSTMAQAQTKYLRQDHVKRAFPYWQYKTVDSPGHRPTHEALKDLVFPVDDPFWLYHNPPWEPGCKCDKVPRSAEWVKEHGVKVSGLSQVRETLGVPPGSPDWRLGDPEAKLDLSGLDDDLKAALKAVQE